MATTFQNSLNSDASATFTYTVSGVTVTYPGQGVRLNTGGAGDYSLGLRSKAAVFGVPGMYFEYSTTRASSGNTYAFSGIRKDTTLAATGCYGVGWINANLESNAASTVLGSANDTWYKIKLIIKSDDTIDLYVDDVFIENINPGVTLVGQALYLQLGGAYYSPVVGYKDVTIYDPRDLLDSSDCSASTGWTLDETEGTVAFTGGEMILSPTTMVSGADNGAFRTAAIAATAYDEISFSFQVGGNIYDTLIVSLTDDAAGGGVLPGTENRVSMFVTDTDKVKANRTLAGSVTTLAGELAKGADTTVYNGKFFVNSNGSISAYTKVSTSETWTSLGTFDTTFDFTTNLYFQVWGYRDWSGSTLMFDDYSWTQLPEAAVGGDGGMGGAAAGLFNKIFSNRRKI